MSFNRFSSNRSTQQNYGNVKGSRRDQIIAESRAKRQERQKKKKHENATQIIQKWHRMNLSYNKTINQCKKQFNDKITFILQKSQNADQSELNFANFNHLLHLFKISLFGFKQNPNKWKLSKKYTSKLSKFEADNKWFTTSVRRLYSIFSRIIKTSTKSQHFISQIIDDSNRYRQMIQFKLLSLVLIKYLEIRSNSCDIKEQQTVIMSLWTIIDCNKWKYFDKISKIQQTQCQVFGYKLLKYLFIKTPFLSVISSIFTTHMKLPSSDNHNANNTKTILALLHTIIIRYFQFAHIHKNNTVHTNDNESKMDESNIINEEDSELQVISCICLEILSIPYYTERLIAYNLNSVIKSFISHNIWSQIITQFNKYCMNTYESFIFLTKHNNKKQKTLNDLWQKIISSPTDQDGGHCNEEKNENKNELDVMDMPDYDDYNDSDSDIDDEMDEMDGENNKNSLQTFLNMTQTSNEENTSHELYMNPNRKTSSLNKRKKSRKKRRTPQKGMDKSAVNFVTDLPAIVWTIHNLLNLYYDFKTFTLNNEENVKLFISFLDIAQITFNLLDFITPLQYGYHIAFPYENMDNIYNNYYLHTFNKWCGGNLLSNISAIISLSTYKICLNDYCILSKYLLQIIRHFPANKQHQIWSNLGLITVDNNICDTNIISLLYKNVFCKFNILSHKDWQSIMKQYLNGYAALSYFQQKKKQLSHDAINEYNSSVSSLQECTKCMQIFELFLHGINYFLRIIDDEQFHKYNIPFTPDIWVVFINTFKYISFVSYWKYYSYFNKFHAYFKRISQKKYKIPLSALNLLEIYNEKFEQFVSSVTCVFACLRDRNSRKTFINENNIWLMDKYIDLHQFEKEILNSQDSDMKTDDNDIEMQNNNAFPQVYNNNNSNFVDEFNPFRNREFGYNEMYGGVYEDNNAPNQSQENLQRFEDNFNKNQHKTNSHQHEHENYRRSFLILIEIPFVIPFKLRVRLFFKLIQYEKDKLESGGQSIRINRGNAIRVRIHRDNILDDGYRELNKYNHELKTLIQIEFLNKHNEIEAGIDGGGIFKEFLNELIRDAFDPERGLFYETEFKKELYPNPNYFVFKQLMNIDKDYYQFLGKMVGKALYDCVLIEPIFCNFFLRKLLSQHNYMDDLQSFDMALYKQLMWLKHDYLNENKIENMEISFSITQDILGSKQTYNLIGNGENILVNHKNRHKYINILADYKLNKCMQQQCASFVAGMSKVINLDYLRIFDANELSKLLSGDNDNIEININDLRANTVYSGGFHHLHRCVKWFWQILKDEFSQKDKQKLLMFVTSCTRSPLLGFKSLNPKFSVMCTGGQIQNLPTSQTCMNLLKLPNYNTKELLKQKLLKSIRSNAGFDLS